MGDHELHQAWYYLIAPVAQREAKRMVQWPTRRKNESEEDYSYRVFEEGVRWGQRFAALGGDAFNLRFETWPPPGTFLAAAAVGETR